MSFFHRLSSKRSPSVERGYEASVTFILLVLAFAAASFESRLPYHLGIAATLILAVLCAVYNLALQIRNQRRKIPFVVDTEGRWTCEKDSIEEVDSYLDYYCEIPRSEHHKGPMPRVSILDRNAQPVLSDYIVRPNETGDVRIYFHPRRTTKIATTPPIKLAITGKS